MKYILSLCAFLALWGVFNQYRVNYAQNKITILEHEKKNISEKLEIKENEIKKFNESQAAAGKQIEKIKTKIVKIPASCYNSVIDSAIIDGVRGK